MILNDRISPQESTKKFNTLPREHLINVNKDNILDYTKAFMILTNHYAREFEPFVFYGEKTRQQVLKRFKNHPGVPTIDEQQLKKITFPTIKEINEKQIDKSAKDINNYLVQVCCYYHFWYPRAFFDNFQKFFKCEVIITRTGIIKQIDFQELRR